MSTCAQKHMEGPHVLFSVPRCTLGYNVLLISSEISFCIESYLIPIIPLCSSMLPSHHHHCLSALTFQYCTSNKYLYFHFYTNICVYYHLFAIFMCFGEIHNLDLWPLFNPKLRCMSLYNFGQLLLTNSWQLLLNTATSFLFSLCRSFLFIYCWFCSLNVRVDFQK